LTEEGKEELKLFKFMLKESFLKNRGRIRDKMKQIILIIFLLCLPLVPAINWYAGNQESIILDFPPRLHA